LQLIDVEIYNLLIVNPTS